MLSQSSIINLNWLWSQSSGNNLDWMLIIFSQNSIGCSQSCIRVQFCTPKKLPLPMGLIHCCDLWPEPISLNTKDPSPFQLVCRRYLRSGPCLISFSMQMWKEGRYRTTVLSYKCCSLVLGPYLGIVLRLRVFVVCTLCLRRGLEWLRDTASRAYTQLFKTLFIWVKINKVA